MKRKEVRELIQAHAYMQGGGRGKKYECWLNGEHCSYQELMKEADEGDKVTIEVWDRDQWYQIGRTSFYIDSNDPDVEWYLQHLERTKKHRSPRDSQRQKVYDWERQALPKGKQLTYQQLDRLAADVYETYGYDNPPRMVVSSAKKSYSSYYPGLHEIRLAEGWGQYQPVVLHELAHALIKSMGIGKKVPSHGKEFTALYMELCELYLDMSDEQIQEAKAAGRNLGACHSFKVE